MNSCPGLSVQSWLQSVRLDLISSQCCIYKWVATPGGLICTWSMNSLSRFTSSYVNFTVSICSQCLVSIAIQQGISESWCGLCAFKLKHNITILVNDVFARLYGSHEDRIELIWCGAPFLIWCLIEYLIRRDCARENGLQSDFCINNLNGEGVWGDGISFVIILPVFVPLLHI